jgi:hypothetical protein
LSSILSVLHCLSTLSFPPSLSFSLSLAFPQSSYLVTLFNSSVHVI